MSNPKKTSLINFTAEDKKYQKVFDSFFEDNPIKLKRKYIPSSLVARKAKLAKKEKSEQNFSFHGMDLTGTFFSLLPKEIVNIIFEYSEASLHRDRRDVLLHYKLVWVKNWNTAYATPIDASNTTAVAEGCHPSGCPHVVNKSADNKYHKNQAIFQHRKSFGGLDYCEREIQKLHDKITFRDLQTLSTAILARDDFMAAQDFKICPMNQDIYNNWVQHRKTVTENIAKDNGLEDVQSMFEYQ